MKSSFILTLITLILSSSNVNSITLNTQFDSGFKIMQLGQTTGAGTNATSDLNKDSTYDFWGGYCGKTKNYLCFPSPEMIFLSIPENTKYIALQYYTDDGYGSNAAKISTSGQSYSFDIHSFATYVNRPLRLQVYDNIVMSSSNCKGTNPGKTLSPLSSERIHGVNRVYDLVSEERWSTCEVNLENLNNKKLSRISVSLGAIQFRYDNNILKKIPSGKHHLNLVRKDSIKYKLFDKENQMISSGTLFDDTAYNININVEAFLDFTLLTPKIMKMFSGPQTRGRQFFHVKTLLKTNLPFVNATIQCQHTIENKCAISDGVTMLPLSMGARSDHRTADNYSLEMSVNTPINLTSKLGVSLYTLNKLTFMLGLDSEDINNLPQSFGKTYSGNVTIIVEGGFD